MEQKGKEMEVMERKSEIRPHEITADDVRKYLCPKATDKEIFIALGIIKAYNLDWFKREVHIIKYGDEPAQVVVGYNVYLKHANRSKVLKGWNVDIVRGQTPGDDEAVVTIYRSDWTIPFIWKVSRREVSKIKADGRPAAMWGVMPDFMFKKTAIAQAFRMCLPEMGGLPYTTDEMGVDLSEGTGTQVIDANAITVVSNGTDTSTSTSAPSEHKEEEAKPAEEPAKEVVVEPEIPWADRKVEHRRIRMMFLRTREAGITEERLYQYISDKFGVSSSKSLTNSMMDKVEQWIKNGGKE